MALSSARSRESARIRAFTLVELLVVIGILALLISILLPVMGRARESAANVKCMSNLRTIGQAIAGYQAENKGSMPWGFVFNRFYPATDTSRGGLSTETPSYLYYWASLLNKYVDPKATWGGLWRAGEFSQIFKCPSVDTGTYRQSVHYGFHSVAMPSLRYELQGDPGMYDKRDPRFPVIKPATNSDVYPDTVLVWDTFVNGKYFPGSQYTDFGWRYSFIDGGQLLDGGNPWLRYRRPGKEHFPNAPGLRQDEPIFLGNPVEFPEGFEDDADTGNTYWNYHAGSTRFRHFKNTGCNVLTADGSVQSKRLELKKRIPGTVGTGSWSDGGVMNEILRSQVMLKWPTSMEGPPTGSAASDWVP